MSKVVSKEEMNALMNATAPNEKDDSKARDQIKEMCEKLLANQIIEDFKISKKE